MKDFTKMQKGSPSRDKFKWLHKQLMPASCWALDSDLELIEKSPFPFIVARIDFKLFGDGISFTEAISYHQLITQPPPYTIPVYVIVADRNFKIDEVQHTSHRFDVWKMTSANYRPDPPIWTGDKVLEQASWDELKEWELELRKQRQAEMQAFVAPY